MRLTSCRSLGKPSTCYANCTPSVAPATTSFPANKSPAPPPGNEPEQERDNDLQELIEDERARLQTAEAVLACLHFARTYDDYFEPNEAPSYPEVAQVAMGLIRTAVDRLDPLYVGRQIREASAGAQPIDD